MPIFGLARARFAVAYAERAEFSRLALVRCKQRLSRGPLSGVAIRVGGAGHQSRSTNSKCGHTDQVTAFESTAR